LKGKIMSHDADMGPLARFATVKSAISRAAQDAGRSPDDVTLIAVSKTFDAGSIRPLLDAGHRVFGENRVQESQGKWPSLKASYAGVELHLIGQQQSQRRTCAVRCHRNN
jgi:PLP dependent protein